MPCQWVSVAGVGRVEIADRDWLACSWWYSLLHYFFLVCTRKRDGRLESRRFILFFGFECCWFFSWFSVRHGRQRSTQELNATRSSCMSFCILVPPISSSIPPSFDARGRRRRHDTTWGGGLTRPAPDLSSSNQLIQRMTPPRCTYRLGASTMAETAARHVYTISPCSRLGRKMASATRAGYPTASLTRHSSPPPGTVHVSG